MENKKKRYESLASLFVGGAIFACLALLVVLATTKGWFEAKAHYYTLLESGDGVHVGSPVEMVGIRVGVVSAMELDEQNQIRTHLRLLRKFEDRIRSDSRIVLARPFLVGDKVLHLSPGNPQAVKLAEGGMIPSEDSLGVMDILGGKKLSPYFKTLELAATEMKKLIDMLAKEKSSEKLVRSLSGMPELISRMTVASDELSKVSVQMTQDDRIGNLVSNMATLSEEFKKIIPAIAVVAPDLPRSSQRMVEALDEAVVVLKAMQKSFFLRSSAREVREEEAARMPASKSEEKEPKD